MEQNTHKKRRANVWLIVLAVILLALAALCFWQKDNIRSLVAGLRYSSDELEERLQENEQTVQHTIDDYENIEVRAVTEAEKHALQAREITPEELSEDLVETDENGNLREGQSDYQRSLSLLVARAVVMREESSVWLDDLESDAMAEIYMMPEKDRTKKGMVSLARKYIGRASELETEYDNKMIALTDEIEALTADHPQDASIADAMLESYIREKELKKALYISKLQKRGMTQ